MSAGDDREIVTARTEDRVDFDRGLTKPLRLTRRFKPPHDLLSFSAQTMRVFNSVVQALVGSMIGIWRDSLYRFRAPI